MPGTHNRGANENKENFSNFCRLNKEGQKVNVQPTDVTGAVVSTEGDQQQNKAIHNDVKNVSPLQNIVDIEGGNQYIHKNTAQRCHQLAVNKA